MARSRVAYAKSIIVSGPEASSAPHASNLAAAAATEVATFAQQVEAGNLKDASFLNAVVKVTMAILVSQMTKDFIIRLVVLTLAFSLILIHSFISTLALLRRVLFVESRFLKRCQGSLELTQLLLWPLEWPNFPRQMFQKASQRSIHLSATKIIQTKLSLVSMREKLGRLMHAVGRYLSQFLLIILVQLQWRMTQKESWESWLGKHGKIGWNAGNGVWFLYTGRWVPGSIQIPNRNSCQTTLDKVS